MKKNICRIFVIVAYILMIATGKSNAQYSNGLDLTVSVMGGTTEFIIDQLIAKFNYKGSTNQIDEKAKWDTTITYINSGKVKIGTGDGKIQEISVSKEQLKALGYDEYKESPDYNPEDPSWKAVLIVTTGYKGILGSSVDEDSSGGISTVTFHINEVYSGDKLTEGQSLTIQSEKANLPSTERTDNQSNFVETAISIWNFANEFKEDPSGTLLNWITDLMRSIGDSIQTLANSFQTFEDGKDEITYSEDFLKSNEERKDYVNIGEYKAGKKSRSYQKYIDVNPGENEEGEEMTEFSKSTEIPVIPVDIYTIAIGDIDVLDVNFLVPNKKAHSENSWWMKLRNISTTVIHLAIYVAAAFLITSLIWNGLHLVRGSLSPEKRKEHVNALNRFATSLVMLVGTVIIMAIGIYANEMFLPKAKGENASQIEYPIRVNVKDAEYSFSTNITGYVRYMAQIENKKLAEKRFSYTGVYLILAFVNLMSVLAMLVRLVCMMVLAMIGPIIVVLHVLNIENRFKLTYKDWAKWYLRMAALQVILALICRLMLDVAITVVE